MAGCGLLTYGPTQEVEIRTDPEGATASFRGATITTPGKVRVPRHKGVFVLRVSKRGYHPACKIVVFDKDALLVVLDSLPAAIPLGLDTMAGSWPGAYPSPLEVTLTPAEGTEPIEFLPSDDEIVRARLSRARTDLCDQGAGPLETWRATYEVALVSVDRPDRTSDEYGPAVRSEKVRWAHRSVRSFIYEDADIELRVLPEVDQIGVKIRNVTPYAAKVLWDDAAFVDLDATSHRVVHSGVSDADRGHAQPASVVAPRKVLEDVIVPVNRVGDISDGLPRLPIAGPSHRECSESEEHFESAARDGVGKSFEILLPIEIAGTMRRYALHFQIEKVDFQSARSCPSPPPPSRDTRIRVTGW